MFFVQLCIHNEYNYQDGIPSVYHGDLTSVDLMHWIVHEKSEESILSVTGPMLERMAETQNYLAVIFLGDCDPEFDENTYAVK